MIFFRMSSADDRIAPRTSLLARITLADLFGVVFAGFVGKGD
jgi:hypothetical protein